MKTILNNLINFMYAEVELNTSDFRLGRDIYADINTYKRS